MLAELPTEVIAKINRDFAELAAPVLCNDLISPVDQVVSHGILTTGTNCSFTGKMIRFRKQLNLYHFLLYKKSC